MLFYIKKLFSYISLFFNKGALSDKGIKKLLGYHIFIYPFKDNNLKPSSYNLTASNCAFIKEEDGTQKLIVEEDTITIPKGKTAIIETEESIYVSRWITGTYHSRVRLVNKGLGHIGTTLDSCFFGVSAIALHNTTQQDIEIKVGESIATIMFYSLTSRSNGIHDNMSARVDDDINLNVNAFYKDNKKNRKITMIIKDEIDKKVDISYIKDQVAVINSNKLKQKKSFLIYDIEKPVCKNCLNCEDKETCSYRLLKNISDEEYKKQKVLERIKNWKSQPWITSKDALIKKVENKVKKDNNNKDIVFYTGLTLSIGFGIGLKLFMLIKDNKYPTLVSTFNTIIVTIIPTVAIIIGMITNYKKKYKGE